jgi:hypothetical protein
MGNADRVIRVFIAALLLVLSFFWLGGIVSYIGYVLAAVMFLTALSGFCPLYKPFGICTIGKSRKSMSRRGTTVMIAVLAGVLIGTGAVSHLVSQRLFIRDFNTMNNYYKQALFLTGQNLREKAVENYKAWTVEFNRFREKYASYKPLAIRGDSLWDRDITAVLDIMKKNETAVIQGDLKLVHLELEKVRSVFQEMFKRNGFSMLSLTLVEFHDEMERMLDAANASDPQKVISLYPSVDEKLKAVESEANDDEIKAIRGNLDGLLDLAKQGKKELLPAKGAELKKSFVNVYLKRG